ncbi:MAG: hypothetical protein PF694_09730 [Bacteroidetes bacterium]|jgi:hypothetical protein|nr:hypothetical protein [Bacteroidota bacterium]
MEDLKIFDGIFDKHLKTDFEKNLLKACHSNLQDTNNSLRFNNYAYSLRELSRHLLKRLAPDDRILKCKWYKNEIPDKENGITRNQRIKYAIQGGLLDSFIEEELGLDIFETKKKLKDAITILNKHTHVNEDTFALEKETVKKHVSEINDAFSELFSDIELCRNEIVSGIESAIDEALIQRTVDDVIEDLDELSTHHTINYLDYDIKVKTIDDSEIIIDVTGNINVTQQFGSNGDLKRGDGYEIENSFPYDVELKCPLDKVTDFKPVIETINVNTDDW